MPAVTTAGMWLWYAWRSQDRASQRTVTVPIAFRPAFPVNLSAAWLPRVAGVVLFVALCALVTHWVLVFSAMRTIPVPQSARVAQTEAVETGAAATLFGGTAQAGRDVQLLGVVADIDMGSGAAIVSIDGGPPKAVRVGTELSQRVRLAEIRPRSVVIERGGVRQEIILPVKSGPVGATPPLPPAGAAAPLATSPQPVAAPVPMVPPPPATSQVPPPLEQAMPLHDVNTQ